MKNLKLTLANEFGSIILNGFSYPEWRRDMDPMKPSNLFYKERCQTVCRQIWSER